MERCLPFFTSVVDVDISIYEFFRKLILSICCCGMEQIIAGLV